MIQEYFGLTGEPFGKDILPGNLYQSLRFKELLARLDYGVKKRYFCLVTGDIGAGKSTAIRLLAQNLDENKHKLLYLSDSNLKPRDFYRELLFQLGSNPGYLRIDAKRQFNQLILDYFEKRRITLIVVIDEAHLLSHLMLQEIRFLTNFRMDSLSPMTLILVGQPELKGTLAMQIFQAITQRIQVRYHLGGLTLEETGAYVAHHLEVVKARSQIFSTEAIKEIFAYSKGVPRLINNLCLQAMLDARIQDSHVVDREGVLRAIEDFRKF